MIGSLEPVCRIIRANINNSRNVQMAISQYITTCELEDSTIESYTHDDYFSSFVQYATDALLEMDVHDNPTGICSELAITITHYFSTLGLSHPILLDTIVANAQIDKLIVHFFYDLVRTGQILQTNSKQLFPFVKFIAICCTSSQINIQSVDALHTLFSATSQLLSNPQLSAWAASIIGNACRYCQSARSYTRSLPNLLQIKRDLLSLISSNDTCVVNSALSAITALFSMKSDLNNTKHAAIHFLRTESPFPLMVQQATATIGDIANRIDFTDREIMSILEPALSLHGAQQYHILRLIYGLDGYHQRISKLISGSKYIEQLLLSINENSYTMNIGCRIFQILSESTQYLFSNSAEDSTFDFLLQHILSSASVEESFLINMNIFLSCYTLRRDNIVSLRMHEDSIFVSFLRSIESCEAFLSICWCKFIIICSDALPHWIDRMKRIAIETPFFTLIPHVMTHSLNRDAINLGAEIMQFFMNCDEIQFSNSIVAGFLLINQKMQEEKLSIEEEHKRHIEALQEEISRAEEESRMTSSELSSLQSEHQTLEEIYNKSKKEHEEGKTKVTPSEVEELKKQIERLEAENRALHESEKELKAKIEAAQKENEELKDNAQQSVKIVERHIPRIAMNAQTDEAFLAAQSQIVDLTLQLQRMTQERQREKEEKRKNVKELDSLKIEKSEDEERIRKLEHDLEQTQRQVAALKVREGEIKEMKRKFKLKKEKLEKRARNAESEMKKWESVARFSLNVRCEKAQVGKEVYKDLK